MMRDCCFYFSLLFAFSVSSGVLAQEYVNTPDKNVEFAKPLKAEAPLNVESDALSPLTISFEQLKNDKILTEQFLNQAIENGNTALIEPLLAIYMQFETKDPILVLFAQAQMAKRYGNYSQAISLYRQILARAPHLTPVRIQLAIAYFDHQQNNDAQTQFEQALTDPHLPADIKQLVKSYLTALENRNRWQVSLSVNYLNEKNVNHVSSASHIENTPFRKNRSMQPEKAKGIGYSIGAGRDFNVKGAHYFHLENSLYGKNYWNNHDYDEITNRLLLGYVHKNAKQRIALLPFYEQQWYANHRYKRSVGGRIEFNHWFSPKWQLSQAVEFAQNFYKNTNLDGNSKLLSNTLLWRVNPSSFLFAGVDFAQERTRLRHYGYDLKTVRIGWGQDWSWGISSRVNLSASQRLYKDRLSLGSAFHFDQRRKDAIFQLNLTAWKRDWHFWGITPKLNFHWKKQDSNFDTLYSYTDKRVNLLLEKTF